MAFIPIDPNSIAVVETNELRRLCSHFALIIIPFGVAYKVYEGDFTDQSVQRLGIAALTRVIGNVIEPVSAPTSFASFTQWMRNAPGVAAQCRSANRRAIRMDQRHPQT